jgi:carbonic anhydrase
MLTTLRHAGINLESWLTGFDDPVSGVRASVEIVRNHPLLPKDVAVHGLIVHPATGKLELLVDGYA